MGCMDPPTALTVLVHYGYVGQFELEVSSYNDMHMLWCYWCSSE